jgi:hypothetical protein
MSVHVYARLVGFQTLLQPPLGDSPSLLQARVALGEPQPCQPGSATGHNASEGRIDPAMRFQIGSMGCRVIDFVLVHSQLRYSNLNAARIITVSSSICSEVSFQTSFGQ